MCVERKQAGRQASAPILTKSLPTQDWMQLHAYEQQAMARWSLGRRTQNPICCSARRWASAMFCCVARMRPSDASSSHLTRFSTRFQASLSSERAKLTFFHSPSPKAIWIGNRILDIRYCRSGMIGDGRTANLEQKAASESELALERKTRSPPGSFSSKWSSESTELLHTRHKAASRLSDQGLIFGSLRVPMPLVVSERWLCYFILRSVWNSIGMLRTSLAEPVQWLECRISLRPSARSQS